MPEYYPLQKNWRKVRPHLNDPKVQAVLVRDFNKFTWGRWQKEFKPGMLPEQFESCDWRCDHRGRTPAYWRYTKHAACHWLVNFSLRLAERVEPKQSWRIITSQAHSTVWDGNGVLFDFNFQAMGIAPEEAFAMARKGRELKPGKELRVYLAQDWHAD